MPQYENGEMKKLQLLSRLATVACDSNDAITMHNFEGRILAWNPRAEQIYGWSETETLAFVKKLNKGEVMNV